MPSPRNFFIHCILAGTLIFIFVGLFLNIRQLQVIDVLNPIEETLSDLEISDLAQSKIRTGVLPDTSITLVNIGNLDRAGIARQLEIINLFQPRAVGIDVFFMEPKDSASDKVLQHALDRIENLVMASRLLENDKGEVIGIERSHDLFTSNAFQGFANLDTEALRQEDYKTCRNFPPSRTIKGEYNEALAVKLAEFIPGNAVEILRSRKKAFEPIYFLGNAADMLGTTEYGSVFNALDVQDVLALNFDAAVIRDKIVILGYMGSDFSDTSWDDRFYTPLNDKYVGKTNPDMYGAVVHANITSMLANGRFINEIDDSKGWGILRAIGICLFILMIFSLIHFRYKVWYDGLTKLIQVLELLGVLFVIVWIFHDYNIKLNLLLSTLVIVLYGDLLEVYYSLIWNIYRKVKYFTHVINQIFLRHVVTFFKTGG